MTDYQVTETEDGSPKAIPQDHADTHQTGGDDEIDLANLQGKSLYVDRGDPDSFDKVVGDFIMDKEWRDLDLSSIVPAGAKFIGLRLTIKADYEDAYFTFRKKGNVNEINVSRITASLANISHDAFRMVPCDVNRVIQYMGENGGLAELNLVVSGWVI